MDKPKLTINQLKNYLGTGLKCEVIHKTIDKYELVNKIFTLDSIDTDSVWKYWTSDKDFCLPLNFKGRGFRAIDFKPHMYRLSDLDKFIPELGFVPLEKIDRVLDFNMYDGKPEENLSDLFKEDIEDFRSQLLFTEAQKLFQWHFWVFDQSLFDEGLIIDKLTHGKETTNV